MFVFVGIIFLATIFLVDEFVKFTTSEKVYNIAQDVPHSKVGLLLGTGKHLSGGRINLYYKHRIEATVELFNAQKIDVVLVSGDNSRKDYDEPSTMKDDLMEKGVPADKIVLDYAGFRTLDSVVRCKRTFKNREK